MSDEHIDLTDPGLAHAERELDLLAAQLEKQARDQRTKALQRMSGERAMAIADLAAEQYAHWLPDGGAYAGDDDADRG